MPLDQATRILNETALKNSERATDSKAVQTSPLAALCEFLEENEKVIGVLREAAHQLFDFIKEARKDLSEATAVSPAGLVKKILIDDAPSYLVERMVVKIEVLGTDPPNGVQHYQHRDQFEGEKYVVISARVFAEPTYFDEFVGCLKALGIIDLPKVGPMKDVPVTFDMTNLTPHFWMTADFGVHTAPSGAGGGPWETYTDQSGIARFKLRVHEELRPSGQGSVKHESLTYSVAANPSSVTNVLAEVLNVLDLGLLSAQGTVVAEWHDGSV